MLSSAPCRALAQIGSTASRLPTRTLATRTAHRLLSRAQTLSSPPRRCPSTRPPTPASSRSYATSTTPASSANDPAEEEAQRHLEQGTAHLETGEMDKAKASYRRSLEIKPNSSALFNLGVCYYHDRDLPAAIDAWTESLRLSPQSADAHTNLASAYVLSKPSRPDLAIWHLKTAAGIAPDDPEIQFNLGAVLEACEQLEEALTAYRRALEGGIQRAEQNIRNCSAKVLGAKVAVQQQQQREQREKQAAGSKE